MGLLDWIKRKKRLEKPLESDTFCMAPWVHIHTVPKGNVFPCCMSAHLQEAAIGNLYDGDTLESSWNSARMKGIRKDMLVGKKLSICEKCYLGEKRGQGTFRQAVNHQFAQHIDRLDETKPDGTFDKFEVPYLDIRFSNVCNLRCRICSHDFSSSWYKEAKELGWLNKDFADQAIVHTSNDPDKLWKEIEALLPTLEVIQFAGGEPLIMEEHYLILDKLIDIGRTDVRITYNTNLSRSKFKQYDVIEMWSQFSDIFIMASLDGSHERGEYLRKGQDWKETVAFRERMLEVCPNVRFRLDPTVCVQNVLHLPDLYQEWYENGYIGVNDIAFNMLYDPPYYNITSLPKHIKKRVEDKYSTLIKEYLMNVPGISQETINHFTAVVEHMYSDNIDQTRKFNKVTKQLDVLREENFADIFPELSEMVD